MATLHISLPDVMKRFVEEQAASRGFATVSDYMRSMIQEAQERHAARERVDALLLEGLDSGPATPMTRADWDDIRREVHLRHAERRGPTHGSTASEGR